MKWHGTARVSAGHITLLFGWTRLTLAENGEIPRLDSDCPRHPFGFVCANTRLLSGLSLRCDGRPPELALSGPIGPDAWFGTFRVPGTTEEGDLEPGHRPMGALEWRVGRMVEEGMREVWWLKNYAHVERRVTLELVVESSIDDEMDVARGRTHRHPIRPRLADGELTFVRDFGTRRRTPRELDGVADGEPVVRGVSIRPEADGPFRIVAGPRGFRVAACIPADGEVSLAFLYEPLIDGRRLPAPPVWRPRRCDPPHSPDRVIETDNAVFDLIIRRARDDLELLALPDFARPFAPATLSAGVPLYVGMFGRDSLTAAWQAALFSPWWMEGALYRLGSLQTDRYDRYRAAEPGRLPHERRLAPNTAIGKKPHELYYADLVAPPFWVVALASAFAWIGRRDLVARHLPTAQRCIDWLERALQDGDGLVWDIPLSATRNQGWKDSGDGIVDGAGRICAPPIALVEEQGYAYLALLAFGALLMFHGRKQRSQARRYFALARALKARFNERFWMPRSRFYALAVAPDGRTVDAIASNPGHALACGIIAEEHAHEVAARLMSEDMFSGLGVRTLSAENPAYDPFSYHRGSIWPVENGTFSAAFALWGFDRELALLLEGFFRAAALFEHHRLPEVFGGQPLDVNHPLPGLYPAANPLQAWSSSAVSLCLQAMLGIVPVAPLRTLFVRPQLPPWLSTLLLRELAVGKATVDLRFSRDDHGRSHCEVLRKRGTLLVTTQKPPLAGGSLLANLM